MNSRQQNEFKSFVQDNSDIILPTLDDVIDYIRCKFEPEDVFSKGALDNWAIDAGYKKENQE